MPRRNQTFGIPGKPLMIASNSTKPVGYELLTGDQLNMLDALYQAQYASGLVRRSGNCTGMHSFSFIENHVTFWAGDDWCVPAHVARENAWTWRVEHQVGAR